MDDYLSKPVKMADLEEKLAKYRSNARAAHVRE
jgi:hypothetical protein